MTTVNFIGGARKSFQTDSLEISQNLDTLSQLITYLVKHKPENTPDFDGKNLLIAVNGVDSSALDGNDTKLNSNDIIANYKLYIEGEQKCVISLKPVKFLIKENFTINFCDHKKIELTTLEDEFIEPVYNEEVNFSEIAIQMFASFLDPYPKINNGNVSLESVYKDKSTSNKNKNNPFEVLNNLNK